MVNLVPVTPVLVGSRTVKLLIMAMIYAAINLVFWTLSCYTVIYEYHKLIKV